MNSDNMQPTLRGGHDYVLVAPAHEFSGDGLYVIEMRGVPCVYRAQRYGRDEILLIRDNPAYRARPEDQVPIGWFEEHLLGKVVADIKVREADLLRTA